MPCKDLPSVPSARVSTVPRVVHFADFATSSGIMRVGGNKKGVFTRDRRPKAAVAHLRQRWLGRS